MTDQLQVLGEQEVAGFKITGIEGGFGEGKKAMLVKEIAEIHNQPLKEINRRINDNKKRFVEGTDIIDLLGVGLSHTEIKEFGFTQQAINSYVGLKAKGLTTGIYILSERGYAKLLKILEDDTAWELYDKLVDGYFNMREQQSQMQELSPQLQILIKMELEQKRMNQEITAAKQIATEAGRKVDSISEIVALNSTDWRKDTTTILNKIALKTGGFDQYRIIRNESYELLEKRANANLSIRVTNKQKKMALEGVAKSKIDKVSKLDVIDEDKRLLEIYLAVVKEMAIKYQVEYRQSGDEVTTRETIR